MVNFQTNYDTGCKQKNPETPPPAAFRVTAKEELRPLPTATAWINPYRITFFIAAYDKRKQANDT
jgi:hypothetical protein